MIVKVFLLLGSMITVVGVFDMFKDAFVVITHDFVLFFTLLCEDVRKFSYVFHARNAMNDVNQ